MKKSLYFFMAASVVIAASCAKEEPAAPVSESCGFKSLTVIAKSADVKTALGEKTGSEYAVDWKAGDAVSVNGTASQPLEADAPSGTPATFRIAETVSAPYDVIYPASAVNADGTVTIPAVQEYAAGQFDPAAAVMTGHSTDSNINMKVACALVKVTVARSGAEAISKISLFSNGEEVLSGRFDADCSAGTLTYVGDASNSVTVTSVDYDGDGKACAVFAVPAGTYQKGFSVLAQAADGSHLGRKAYASSGVTLQAGSMLAMPEFTFSASSSAFSGGDGTESNPYIIAKTADLVDLSNLTNDSATNAAYHAAYYRQICDIDLADIAFSPICFAYKDATAFTGSYDGGGHRISNMTINTTTDGGTALIGYVMGGTVKNVIVENASVEGTKRLGVITGTAWKGSVISNCKAIGSSVHSASANLVGGMVGYCNGSTVTDCEAIGCTFKSDVDYAVSPIIGELYNGSKVIGCTATDCNVFAVQCAGGIVGRVYGGQIRNCVSKGNTITTTERAAGGIAGGISAKTTVTTEDLVIDNCLVTDGTTVKAQYYCGGIMGYIYLGESKKLTITNCGLENASVCTVKDDGSAHAGDCCIGGAVGWLRNSSASCEVQILNNFFYFADGGCRVDEEGINNLAIAGVIGYISNSATSTLTIGGNCTDLATADIVIAGQTYSGTDPEANKIGSVYGHCANDRSTISINRNYWAGDNGITSVGHSLSSAVIEDNESFTTSVFTDGSTVTGKLNTFASGYEGMTLNSWTVKDNRPSLVFNF